MNIKCCLSSLALLLAPTVAAAQSAAHFYGTVSFGATTGNLSVDEINNGFRTDGLFPSSTTIENKDAAYRLGGGYRFSPAVAVELYYADLGKYSSQSVASFTPTSGRLDISALYKSAGVGVDVVFGAPLGEAFGVYGRAGVIRAKTQGIFSLVGSPSFRVTNGTANKVGNVLGVGLKYDVSKQLSVNLEAQRVAKLGDDSTGGELRLNIYSLGANFNF